MNLRTIQILINTLKDLHINIEFTFVFRWICLKIIINILLVTLINLLALFFTNDYV